MSSGKDSGRLLLTRRLGERVFLSDENGEHLAVISITKFLGGQAQLCFQAKPNILIRREELLYREYAAPEEDVQE